MCFNYEITADFPGVTTRLVEETFEGVNCIFVNGAAGNVESLQISRRRAGPDDPIMGEYHVMERVGQLLAFRNAINSEKEQCNEYTVNKRNKIEEVERELNSINPQDNNAVQYLVEIYNDLRITRFTDNRQLDEC